MEISNDDQGYVNNVRARFGYQKSACLTHWNNMGWVHLNDNSKCWQTGVFDKSKGKSISIKWEDALTLKNALVQMEAYADQMQGEVVSLIFNYFYYKNETVIS